MSHKDKKPNIIYILGDDHRAEFMNCAGYPIIETPNLDALANDGVRFKNAFCTSPLCTPSRACHYLGQWERKHGINFNSDNTVSETAWANSFPMILKEQGYFTGWVGKNHVPVGNGGYESGYMEKTFDYWYGNHNHTGFYAKEKVGSEIYSNAKADTQIEIFEEGVMNFLDPQDEFIESCSSTLLRRPKDKPFCLCLTFNLPHDASTESMQLRPSDDELYKSKYRDKFMEFPLPKTYISSYHIKEPRLPREVYNGVYIPSYDYVKTPMALRERLVRVCQTITGMDRMIGNLRRKLEELGEGDNTIIVFSTDHGIHHGEHGIGGKAFLYEEDIRIPLIIYDPRLPENSKKMVREEFVLVPDIAPTVLELMGVKVSETMQGESVLPLIYGDDDDELVNWRDEFFTEQLMDIQNYPRSESVRNKEWKYIRYFKRTEDPEKEHLLYKGTLDNYDECLKSTILYGEQPIYEELYNLKDDPYEEYNLAKDPKYNDILKKMRERILELGRKVI